MPGSTTLRRCRVRGCGSLRRSSRSCSAQNATSRGGGAECGINHPDSPLGLGDRRDAFEGQFHSGPSVPMRSLDHPGDSSHRPYPPRHREHLVRLGNPRPAVGRFEPVLPSGRRSVTKDRLEGQLAAGLTCGDHTLARPADPRLAVVAPEPAADLRTGRVTDPLDTLDRWAPLSHPGHVGDQRPNRVRRSCDLSRYLVSNHDRDLRTLSNQPRLGFSTRYAARPALLPRRAYGMPTWVVTTGHQLASSSGNRDSKRRTRSHTVR